jgi:competence protein ComEA
MTGKLTRTEKILLAVSAAFLCLLLACYLRDSAAGRNGAAVVETQFEAAESEIAPVSTAKLNLNTATAEELQELPGIGEVLAQRIVDYREEHGAFQKIQEIENVNGIGEGKFSDIEDQITVTGEEGN